MLFVSITIALQRLVVAAWTLLDVSAATPGWMAFVILSAARDLDINTLRRGYDKQYGDR